jgi:hypothetical protein
MTRKTVTIAAAVMLGIATTGGIAFARDDDGGGPRGAHAAKYLETHDNDCDISGYLRIMTNLCAYKTPGSGFDGHTP